MVDRVQLNKDIYMNVGGQWAIYLSGSVIDVPKASAFTGGHVTLLNETAGTLVGGGAHPTAVRNVRTK